MGTPDFAVPTLSALVAAGHDVIAAYAQPPRPAGRRGLKETPSPVQTFAEAHNIAVRTPTSLKTTDAQNAFAALGADAAVVVAYGLLLPQAILAAPRLGCLNVHASDLPRWRGAAPIHRAIMAGDRTTAVCIMQMDSGLDTGDVLLREAVDIGADVTTGHLHDTLSNRGAAVLVDALIALEAGTLTAVPQSDQGISYARKISKDETEIDFSGPASDVHNHIRGLSPFPGAWFQAAMPEAGERVKVLASRISGAPPPPGTTRPGMLLSAADFTVACGTGAVRLQTVQRAGGKPCDGSAYLNGAAFNIGDVVMAAAR